jgi:MFS family permease
MVAQLVTAYMLFLVPVIAPGLVLAQGWSTDRIGVLVTISMLGPFLFLVLGVGLIERYGADWAIRLALWLALIGALLFALPLWSLVLVGALLAGLAYGPTLSAGSELIQRLVPPQRRALLFSIKQALVPLGGVVAGIGIPAALALIGIRGTVIASAIVAGFALLLVSIYSARDVGPRGPRQARVPLVSLRGLTYFRTNRHNNGVLLRLSAAGCCLALAQSAWQGFLVAFLIVELALSYEQAGLLFSVMSIASFAGRILFGWLVDLLGNGYRLVQMSCIASTLSLVAWSFVTPEISSVALFALTAVSGVSIASWNGVQHAEVARNAKQDEIAAAASASALILSIGIVAGPALYALLLQLSGDRYGLGFLVVSAVPMMSWAYMARR